MNTQRWEWDDFVPFCLVAGLGGMLACMLLCPMMDILDWINFRYVRMDHTAFYAIAGGLVFAFFGGLAYLCHLLDQRQRRRNGTGPASARATAPSQPPHDGGLQPPQGFLLSPVRN